MILRFFTLQARHMALMGVNFGVQEKVHGEVEGADLTEMFRGAE